MTTVTALQAIKAINALRVIEGQPLPFCSAVIVYKAISDLQPAADAYAKEEMRLVKECAVKSKDGSAAPSDDRYFTVAPDKVSEYSRRRKELDEEPLEWKRRKLDGLSGIMITPAQLASLAALFDLEGA